MVDDLIVFVVFDDELLVVDDVECVVVVSAAVVAVVAVVPFTISTLLLATCCPLVCEFGCAAVMFSFDRIGMIDFSKPLGWSVSAVPHLVFSKIASYSKFVCTTHVVLYE